MDVVTTSWWSNPLFYVVASGIIITALGGAGVGLLKIGKWVGKVNSFTESVEPFMREIRDDIKEIFRRLPPTGPVVSSASPVQLTDFGRAISETASANEWAQANAPGLKADAAGKEEFEVFDLCVSYVQSKFSDDEDFKRIVRLAAYQHGTESESVLKVFQVELRDSLLPGDD